MMIDHRRMPVGSLCERSHELIVPGPRLLLPPSSYRATDAIDCATVCTTWRATCVIASPQRTACDIAPGRYQPGTGGQTRARTVTTSGRNRLYASLDSPGNRLTAPRDSQLQVDMLQMIPNG